MTSGLSDQDASSLLKTLDRLEEIPVMVLGETGEVVLFNSVCEELFGFDSEEVVGSQVGELLAEEDGEDRTSTFPPEESNYQSPIKASFESREGERKDIYWNIIFTEKAEGGSELVICMANPEENKELEVQPSQEYSEVRETAEKYKALFQYAYDAILLSHFETGRIFEANPEAENLLGYQVEELLGKKLPRLFPDENFSQLKERLEGGRFFYRGNQPVQKKDGSRIVTSMSSSLMEFRGKKTILSLFQDMTKRIELEEELKNRAQSLEKSNEKLEEIIHIISHDLKEPLRSIGTYSDMIFSEYHDDLTDASFQRLEDIKEGATRLKKMLDEVSNLAQVTADISPEPVRIPELSDEVKDELGLDLNGVEVAVESDFPEVRFDRFQLKVLLKNLIANGIKYNEEPKQVEVGYDSQPGNSKLAVIIRDNGKGIAEQHQERVFRMFEQLGPDKNSKGTGAGLAICKRIVEGVDEKIWLDSEPGTGTTVCFTVPLLQEAG